MKISAKSVKTTKTLKNIAQGAEIVRLIFPLKEDSEYYLDMVGFNADSTIGYTIIPNCIGKFSTFNAEGRELIRKDLPKEPSSITMFTTWKDWHGREHSGVVTRSKLMYPREYIPAPSEQFYLINNHNELFISSDNLMLDDSHEERNVHVENMMLEFFGEFYVLDVSKEEVINTKFRKLQWDILPPGKYPWESTKQLIIQRTAKFNPSDRALIEFRMEVISSYNPTFLASGRGGFSGYFVYGFEEKGIYVLESCSLNNATYIFNSDWEALSQLTKNEIINGENFYIRIVHDKKWRANLRKIMQEEKK